VDGGHPPLCRKGCPGLTISVDIPGRGTLELEHLILDVNGTLTDRGSLLDGVAVRLEWLGERLLSILVSADTFGTLDQIGRELGIEVRRVSAGMDKLRLVESLGATRTVVIGNGTNDVPALEAAALGIAVLGPEGSSTEALRAADVLCRSSVEALDLLLEPRALAATLRR
jgi:soluble P-type ATPase